MVHALERIHHRLAPTGRLINLHPFAEAAVIEIHQGGSITFSNPVPAYAVEDIQQAEKALAQAVGQGLFAVERERHFEFRTYASSVAELVGYLAEQEYRTDRPQDEGIAAQYEEMAAEVEQLMQAAGEGAEVVFYERAHIVLHAPLAKLPQ